MKIKAAVIACVFVGSYFASIAWLQAETEPGIYKKVKQDNYEPPEEMEPIDPPEEVEPPEPPEEMEPIDPPEDVEPPEPPEEMEPIDPPDEIEPMDPEY